MQRRPPTRQNSIGCNLYYFNEKIKEKLLSYLIQPRRLNAKYVIKEMTNIKAKTIG